MHAFHEYVREVFSVAGDIVIKSMMGGYFVYLNGKREISSSQQTAPNSGFAGSISLQSVEKFISSEYNKTRKENDKSGFIYHVRLTYEKIDK